MSSISIEAKVIKQGEIISFVSSLPIAKLLELLEIPDPNKPFEDNRRVKIKHAREFGNYWEMQVNGWISPPLMLDTAEKLVTRRIDGFPNTLCTVELPVSEKFKLKILDGQHRILGWYLKNKDILKRLDDMNKNYNKAVFLNDKNLKLRSKEEIENLEYLQKRMNNEQVGLIIVSGISRETHRQFFVDIAKNALGINKTVQAKFDVSSIVNRVTGNIMEAHSLLANRIDLENTKCSGDNENILSVVNLADIVRHLGFGINKRVTAKKERDYSDDDLFQISIDFFTLMAESSDVLSQFENESISAKWLRENSLLGSGTIWRCLAGAYHNYCVLDQMVEIDGINRNKLSVDRVRSNVFADFLEQFNQKSSLPISKDWFATGLFPKKTSTGPTSRSQDLLAMVKLFQSWVNSGEIFKVNKLQQ